MLRKFISLLQKIGWKFAKPILGLLLQVGVSFAAFSYEGQTIVEGQLIQSHEEKQEKKTMYR